MRLPEDLTVRSLVPGDAVSCALVTEATDATYLDWMPDWTPASPQSERQHYAEAITEPGRWSVGVFDAGGRLVGHVLMGAAHDRDEAAIAGVGHLTELFVHPDRWRQGIAAVLLAMAEEAMCDRGYSEGRLNTPVRAPAIAFYESQGWAPNGEARYLEQYDLHTIGFSKKLAGADA